MMPDYIQIKLTERLSEVQGRVPKSAEMQRKASLYQNQSGKDSSNLHQNEANFEGRYGSQIMKINKGLKQLLCSQSVQVNCYSLSI